MWLVVLVSAIGVFLLLQSLLGNWRMSGLAVATAIASIAGGVVAALASGGQVSLGAMIGFLAIAAIAVRQSVAMVQHYHDLQTDRGIAHGYDLVQRGSSERLMPALAAALAVASICLPFVLMGNAAGFEIERPMAITILCGLVTSTFMVLFVLPALYLQYGAARNVETINGALPHAAQ
jgi:Cu/Ag efflux pump CusA